MGVQAAKRAQNWRNLRLAHTDRQREIRKLRERGWLAPGQLSLDKFEEGKRWGPRSNVERWKKGEEEEHEGEEPTAKELLLDQIERRR